MFRRKYQRYDDGRFDLAQISNLDRSRYAVEFDKHLKGTKIDFQRYGETKKTFGPVKGKREPKCAVNPHNPLRLEFMGPLRRERVQKREERKQANVELHRIRKHFDKRDLRAFEKKQLEEEANREKRLSPVLLEANFPDVCSDESSSELNMVHRKSEHQPTVPKAIVRTLDKPKNRAALEQEQKIRVIRIRQRLQECHEKHVAREAEHLLQKKEKKAKIDYQVIDEDYREFFEGNDYKYISTGGAKHYPLRSHKTFPNTLREIPYHLRLMNRERRQRRDRARFKENILCSLGARNQQPDAQLDVDTESDSAEYLSRQSTDSNDGMSLGPKTSSRFLLRSFKDPMAADPRGLPRRKIERVRQSTAMTWDEWFRLTVQSWRQSFKPDVEYQHPISKRIDSENFQIVEHDASKFIPIERAKMGSYDSVAEKELIDETLDTAIKICRVPPQRKIQPNVHEPQSKFFKALKLRRHHANWDLTHSQRPRARYNFRDPLGERGAMVEDIPCNAGGKKELFTAAYTHKSDFLELIEEAKRLTIVEAPDSEASEASVPSIVSQTERISAVTLPKGFLETGYTKEQQELIDQTKREVASIASCCSSDSKSTSLVDFSNDSGSLVLHADGRMIPAHTMIHNWKETNNEVFLEPFDESEEPDPRGPPGPMIGLRRMAPKDRYPKAESGSTKFELAKKKTKKKLQIMDDGDECFIKEIKNRPKIETFKRSEYISNLHKNLRDQLSAKWRLENLRLAEIRELEEAKLAREAEEFAKACPPILDAFQLEFFRRAHVQLEQVRPAHHITMELQKDHKEWETKYVRLNQRIIHLEHNWIQCLLCQNFMYMLMPVEWRQVHAWMHKHPDGTLFTVKETIYDRKERVKPRSKESGHAIMKFFNEYFVSRADAPIFVFTDHREVIKTLNRRQDQSLRQMQESRGQLELLLDARTEFEEVREWVGGFLDRMRLMEKKLSKSLRAMEKKAKDAEESANNVLDKTLTQAVYWKQPWRLRAAILTLKKVFHPGTELKFGLSDKYQLYCIERIVQDCLTSLDSIPSDITAKINRRLHWKRKLDFHEALKAQTENRRKEIAVYRLERSLDPPFRKPARIGKLPRYYIRKPRMRTPSPPRMTLRQKILYAAFSEEVDAALTMKAPILDANKLTALADLEKYCIESDFESEDDDSDEDYDPNVKIVTQVEARYGCEEQFVKCQDVLPSVNRFMYFWEQRRESLKKLELKRKAEAKKKKMVRFNV